MEQELIKLTGMMPPFMDTHGREREKALNFFQHMHYRVGKTIYYQEDWADLVYFILSGQIRCIKWRSDESNFLLATAEKGQWLGLAEAISGGVYLCDTECMTSVEVLGIRQSHVSLLFEMEAFRTHMFTSLARGYYTLHNTLSAPGSMELITRYLKRLSGNTGTINITQEEIAHAIGITRETVNKHLNQLQKEDVLTLNRGKITIHNLSCLEDI